MICKNNKKGSAVALCLVFCTVILVLGLAYAKLTSNAKEQTAQLDDVVRLDYIANDIFEKAILKFQLYPSDFYACLEAAKLGETTNNTSLKKYLNDFVNDETLSFNSAKNTTYTSSTFNTPEINAQLTSMEILTDSKWKNEILKLEVIGSYVDSHGKSVSKTVTKLVNLERFVENSFNMPTSSN